MDPEYKKLAEARVTGHSGTSFLEVLVVASVAVLVNALSTSSSSFLSSNNNNNIYLRRFVEWTLLVPPLLLLNSSPSETMTYHIAIAIVVPCLFFMFLSSFNFNTNKNKKKQDSSSPSTRSRESSLSQASSSSSPSFYDPATAMLRSTLMLQTIVAILAVDFPIFPFRFMKCENFGISMMDIGVGAFVFSGAVSRVAGEEMKKKKLLFLTATTSSSEDNKKKTTSSSKTSMLKSILELLGSSIPLFIIGFARAASVAITGYQEHITEYGKHWNFFLTLGFMPLVVALVHKIGSVVVSAISAGMVMMNNSSSSSSNNNKSKMKKLTPQKIIDTDSSSSSSYLFDAVVGLTLLALHQVALSGFFFGNSSTGNLTSYIMSPHRRSLIESNKEGIISSIGYSALYLIGRGVFGLFFVQINKNTRSSSSSSSFASIAVAFVVGLVILFISYTLHSSLQEFSRRLCNAPYVLFCLGLGFVTYSVCAFVAASKNEKDEDNNGSMLSALGDNQLPLFLMSNLCTGAVNHSMKTIFASYQVSYLVMTVYVTFILIVGSVLSSRKIKLKFW